MGCCQPFRKPPRRPLTRLLPISRPAELSAEETAFSAVDFLAEGFFAAGLAAGLEAEAVDVLRAEDISRASDAAAASS